MEEQILQLLSEISQDPKYQGRADLLNKLSSPEYKNILSKVGSATKGVTALAGIAEGIGQKKAGKKAIDALSKPTLPPSAKVDPTLSRLISSAEAKATSPERYGAIGAYQGSMRDAYQAGLDQARTASGGQSGVFGAQGQALYNQRLREASKLPAMTSQIAQQYEGMAGNLAAQKAQADSYAYMNNLDRARLELGQYNKEAEAAADLYRTGAENIYGGMQYGFDALQEPLADILYGGSSTGIQELDDQGTSIADSMNARFNPYGYMQSQYSPATLNAPELQPIPENPYR